MAARNLAFRLSLQVRNTASPPIPQAYKWAESYVQSKDRPLLDMSQGVPGIPPPTKLLEALGKAASDPRSCGYCPMTGEPLLRASLAQEMRLVYGKNSDIIPDDVALTAGCNMAFTTAIMAVADAGDEVILPVPWYFNHEMTLQMLGISPVPLQTTSREGFQPSPERCAKLITEKTKAIILVSPNNPTGAIYPPSLISSFARLARQRNVALIIDETYRDFILDEVPHRLFVPGPLQSSPGLPSDWTWRRHFIHLFSFSKSYCIPGHRLGAIVASSGVLEQVKTVLDCIQICPPRHVQLALYPLLSELRPFIRETAQSLVHRHELFRSLLPPRWKIGSQGAYYAFVQHPFKDVSATEVSRRMAIEGGIVTLPAGFFMPLQPLTKEEELVKDNSRWIRFSVANVDDDKIRKVCTRLRELEDTFGWALHE
ncbi:PLP-dependent transferase [Fomitiporia mediterranea MF3/22]|uniref:PLP-dependent transferase n=1 Tax=Fomitiporia mediterranea (strain MF3/22) TaxID=694068 RepID=UPI0004408ACF|nr:PLP-dependent transferase [Fomitiporia mediterranea MF3/22]EJD01320.1 PLP-dependent transferase [Fomitiporia mediterranea MF3/22]